MFEGSEKKIEIIFSPKSPSLRLLSEYFWRKVIKICGARIISVSKFSCVDSYILSESSLFVWDHRLIIITCGKTNLPKSLIKILKTVSKQDIDVIFYQKKNEFFPWAQKSDFLKDIQSIEKQFKGTSYQFGPLHDHHFLLFHNETDYQPSKSDETLEILMYNSEFIRDTSEKTMNKLKKQMGNLLPNFEIQEHFFNQNGYSLNAVRDNFYYTIHITPEKPYFYISFETNFNSSNDFINKFLNIFKTKNFDLILFKSVGHAKEHYNPTDFSRNAFYHHILNCGYEVTYMNFHKLQNSPRTPWIYKNKKFFQSKEQLYE